MRTDPATVDLNVLRQIGWDNWDPIGIRRFDNNAWQSAAADEYDTYLLEVSRMILMGGSLSEAAAYLDRVISDDMELGGNDASHNASMRTVEAISAYVMGKKRHS